MAAGRDIVLESNLNLDLNLNKKIDLKLERQEKGTDTSVSKALHHIIDLMHRSQIQNQNYFL